MNLMLKKNAEGGAAGQTVTLAIVVGPQNSNLVLLIRQ